MAGNGLIEGGKFALENSVIDKYRNQPGVNDMAPGSSFLSQLNDQPENTLPSARYSIYGAENFQTHWHLMGSLASGPGNVEDDVGIETHRTLLSFYAYLTNISYGTARAYKFLMERAQENYNFQDYIRYKEDYQRWIQIAYAFYVGYDSLYFGQQYQWSKYVTGSKTPSEWQSEDGILNRETQAPAFFDTPDNIDRRLPALGANHLEETAHPNVRRRIAQAFGNSDIDILEVGEDPPPPFTITINGPSGLDSGESGTWTAQLSGTEGSVSYQWYTQSVGSTTWSFRGNNSTMSTTFINQSEPYTVKTARIKLSVTNDGETITEFKDVAIGPAPPPPCGYSTVSGDSVSTNYIPPPDC